MRTKVMATKSPFREHLNGLPSFSRTGNITGMKNRYYGNDALLIRCGRYIYDATSEPDLYYFQSA